MLRGSLRPWWRVVVEGLGLDPGGVAAELVGVFVAFGISGVGHAVAMWTLDRSLGWGQIAFFMLQAVGILVETVVCRAYVSATTYSRKPPHEKGMILGKTDKSLGGTEKLVARLVGYVWVVGWLVYTAPLQTDEFILAGLYRANPAPVSPTHWVLERFGYAGGGV